MLPIKFNKFFPIPSEKNNIIKKKHSPKIIFVVFSLTFKTYIAYHPNHSNFLLALANERGVDSQNLCPITYSNIKNEESMIPNPADNLF